MKYQSVSSISCKFWSWLVGATDHLKGSWRKGGNACWYFKVLAERQEAATTLGDRLFALWALPEQEGSILSDEYGGVEGGGVIWPPSGTLGSDKASSIVERLRSGRPGPPNLIIQSSRLVDVLGVWNVATD
jgi:hypothetical protein